MMKKLFLIPLLIVLVSGLILGGCAAPAPAPTPAPAPKPEPIVLKAITMYPTEWPVGHGTIEFAKFVEAQSNGMLLIDIIGSHDIIPIPDMPEAVRDGTIDIMQNFQTTWEDVVPETIAMSVSQLTPQEERQVGFYDWLDQVHLEKLHVKYLGRVHVNYGFYTFLSKPVQTLDDLHGLKLGLTPIWFAFAKKLGCIPVLMQQPDLYTGMTRGVIDGYMLPPDAAVPEGLTEVTKFVVDVKFYKPSNVVHLMNLDKWNSLSQSQQDLLVQASIDLEGMMGDYYGNVQKEMIQQMIDEGVQRVTLSAADAEWYYNIADEAQWEKAKEKCSPESYAKLREFLIKK